MNNPIFGFLCKTTNTACPRVRLEFTNSSVGFQCTVRPSSQGRMSETITTSSSTQSSATATTSVAENRRNLDLENNLPETVDNVHVEGGIGTEHSAIASADHRSSVAACPDGDKEDAVVDAWKAVPPAPTGNCGMEIDTPITAEIPRIPDEIVRHYYTKYLVTRVPGLPKDTPVDLDQYVLTLPNRICVVGLNASHDCLVRGLVSVDFR